MKKTLLLLLVFSAFLLNSCTKARLENKLTGNWRLHKAERTSFLNWNTLNTGYETGIFSFSNDGTVTYRDNQLNMQGDWKIRKWAGSYQDDDDNDRQDFRFSLTIHLYDFSAGKSLTLDFDDFSFRGRNRFLGKFKIAGYRYRYDFRAD